MHRGGMKRTTFADPALLEEVKALSIEQGSSVAQVVREALTEHVARQRGARKQLSFVDAGRSGRRSIAERHEQLPWRRPPK
jgi:hypothetical protein